MKPFLLGVILLGFIKEVIYFMLVYYPLVRIKCVKLVAGTICGSGAVISPGGISKSIVTINFDNLGSVGSSRRFTGLTFGLMNFYNWSNSAWAIKLLSQPS